MNIKPTVAYHITYLSKLVKPILAGAVFAYATIGVPIPDAQARISAESVVGRLAEPASMIAARGSCRKTLVNSSIIPVTSCDSATMDNLCCSEDEYADDSESCVLSCLCTVTEEETATRTVVDAEHEVLIRGVPIFEQFDIRDRDGNQPVGCGPIAIVELLTWYSAWGFSELTAEYENNAGVIDWEAMAIDAADAANTIILTDGSPTLPGQMENGLESMIARAGYSVSMHRDIVTDSASETNAAFEKIKSNIQQGRPIIIGYDTDADAGGGIGGGGDDWGFIDHYCIIVGYDDTGDTPQIYVNTGWGNHGGIDTSYNGLGLYDWVIGDGRVHLYFVEMTAGEKTMDDDAVVEYCPLDDFASIYDSENSVTITGLDASSLPVMSTLMSDTDCAVVGGTESHEETYTYSDTRQEGIDCAPRYSVYEKPLDLPNDPGVDDPGSDTGIIGRL